MTTKTLPPVSLNPIDSQFLVIDAALTSLIDDLNDQGTPVRYVRAVEQARDQLRKTMWKLPAWVGTLTTPPLPPACVE